MRYLFSIIMILLASCTKEGSPGVVMTEWIVAADGTVSAAWIYPDGRIGGTDFTDAAEIPAIIEGLRDVPHCTRCMRITSEITCWEH